MICRLSEVATKVGCNLLRDAEFESLGFSIHPWPSMLTWLESPKFADLLRASNIKAVVTTNELARLVPEELGVLIHAAPRAAFYQLHEYLRSRTDFYGRLAKTHIDSSASVETGGHVAELGVHIEGDVFIEPGAVVLPGSFIGRGSIIRAGAVVGSEGFQFLRSGKDVVKIKHAGGVHIGEDVEIQSNVVVNRAIFSGHTGIGDQTKIDGLVHVAHNVQIGARCMIAGQAMISGSVTIGDDVWVGPGAIFSHGIRVGDGAKITLGSVVMQDVPSKGHVTGHWAIPHHKFLCAYKRFVE